jgi:hypothetical protein
MEVLELDRPEVFPVETPVGIYLASAVIDTASAPLGNPLQTVKVGFVEEKEGKDVFDTKTKIKFEVAAKGHYVAGAKVGGVWRYVRVPIGNLETNLTPPARYPTHHV